MFRFLMSLLFLAQAPLPEVKFVQPTKTVEHEGGFTLTYKLPGKTDVFDVTFWGPQPLRLEIQNGSDLEVVNNSGVWRVNNYHRKELTVTAVFNDPVATYPEWKFLPIKVAGKYVFKTTKARGGWVIRTELGKLSPDGGVRGWQIAKEDVINVDITKEYWQDEKRLRELKLRIGKLCHDWEWNVGQYYCSDLTDP